MLGGCAPSCLSMGSLARCAARRKQFKFRAELTLAELSDVPLVNAALFVKVRLLDGGNFVGLSHTAPVVGHRAVWKQDFAFVCRIGSHPDTGVLDACLCRVSVRKEAKGGKSYEKLGFVDVNLSTFAGSGQEGEKRCYLLEGYTSDKGRRQDNSRLRVNVALKLLTADTCFKVPTELSTSNVSAHLNPAERRAPRAPSTRSSVTDLGSQANLLTGLGAGGGATNRAADCRRDSDAASCSASASGSAHPSVAGAKPPHHAGANCNLDSDPLEQGSMASSLASSVAFRAGKYGDYANLHMAAHEFGCGGTAALGNSTKVPGLFADNVWPGEERLRWAHAEPALYNSSSGYATTGRASASTTGSSSMPVQPPVSLQPPGAQQQHSRYGSAETTSHHSQQSAAGTAGRLSAASTPLKDAGPPPAPHGGRSSAAEVDRRANEPHAPPLNTGFQTLPAVSSGACRSRRTAETRVDPMRVIEDLLQDDLHIRQQEQLTEQGAAGHSSGDDAPAGGLAPDAHINRFLEDIIRNTDARGPRHSDGAAGGGLALYVSRDEGVAAVVAPGPGFQRVTMPRENRRI